MSACKVNALRHAARALGAAFGAAFGDASTVLDGARRFMSLMIVLRGTDADKKVEYVFNLYDNDRRQSLTEGRGHEDARRAAGSSSSRCGLGRRR